MPKKIKTTLKSFVSPRNRAKASNSDSQFSEAERESNECETKKLIRLMAASGVEIYMGNHYYTIGIEIRKQSEGGAIGSDLTGEEACYI